MPKDPIEELENWSNKGKPYAVELSIEDGYGCSAWTCALYKIDEKYKTDRKYQKNYLLLSGVEYPDSEEFEEGEIFVRNEEEDYQGKLIDTAACDRTLWVTSIKAPAEWPGAKRVILASCEAANKIDNMDNEKEQ